MKTLPVLGLGIALSICSLQTPLVFGQEADAPVQKETLQQRRERKALDRQSEKLVKLQEPIRKVHAMIDSGDFKLAYKGASDIRRRLGEPKRLQVEVLFARLALSDNKAQVALKTIEPFVV